MIAIKRGFTTPVTAGLTVSLIYIVYSQTIYWSGIASAVPLLNLMYYPAYLLMLYFYLRQHRERLSGLYGKQLGEGAIVTLIPAGLYILYVAIFGYLTDYAFMVELKGRMAAEAEAAGQTAAEIEALMVRINTTFTLDKIFRNFAVAGLVSSAIMPLFFRQRGVLPDEGKS